MTEDKDFAQFIKNVKALTKIDLSQYKEQQMKRRLTTLRLKRGYSNFADYFEAIRRDANLLQEFLDRITINVSEFWRNPNRWRTLEQRFIPEMLRTNRKPKVWSAACSTGEEPYTLAMILAEQMPLAQVSVLATDIDEGVLAKARQGVYPDRSVKDVPPQYLSKYFSRDQMLYAVRDELKRTVKFQRQDLLTDTFGQDFDLIVCRNVMIYFTDEAKHMLYQKFADALAPGGILFVGSTEQIFNPGQYGLETADTFFYRKKTTLV